MAADLELTANRWYSKPGEKTPSPGKECKEKEGGWGLHLREEEPIKVSEKQWVEAKKIKYLN